MDWELGGWGFSMAKKFKGKCEAKLEFQEKWERGLGENHLGGGHGYFQERHNHQRQQGMLQTWQTHTDLPWVTGFLLSRNTFLANEW